MKRNKLFSMVLGLAAIFMMSSCIIICPNDDDYYYDNNFQNDDDYTYNHKSTKGNLHIVNLDSECYLESIDLATEYGRGWKNYWKSTWPNEICIFSVEEDNYNIKLRVIYPNYKGGDQDYYDDIILDDWSLYIRSGETTTLYFDGNKLSYYKIEERNLCK